MSFTTLIAEELRALISCTILMINSFFTKAIVWMCLFPTSVGGITRDPASSDLIVALIVTILVLLFFVIVARNVLARKSSYAGRLHRPKEEEPVVVLVAKKRLTMPPLSLTYRHYSNCRRLCRPKKKFEIPDDVSDGYRRVLVPTPGTKCGAHKYIIVREPAQQQQPALPVNKPPLPPRRRATLDTIQEVPNGYTRVLVPLFPGTKCAERDYIIVCKDHHGELLLLEQDGDAVMTAKNTRPPPAAPRKKKKTISRRIDMREKVLPFEMHINIVGHLELLDEESNHPTDGHHGLEQGQEEDNSSSAGSDITFVEEDNVQVENVVGLLLHCAAAVPVATTTVSTSGPPAKKDGTHVFAADSSCNHVDDSIHDVSQLQEQEGSGYYIDDKGRKRRFSLRIMAKKSASTKKE